MLLSTVTHGTGRPVVVLPGLGLDARFTAAVTEPALSHHSDHRRIYLSLPGMGSPASCEPSSDAILELLGDWVRTELGGEPFRLVGYSYGGYLATGLADRLGDQAERLLLVCGGVKIVPEQRDLSAVLPPDYEPGWLDPCPRALHDHLAAAVGRQHRDVGERLAAAFGDMGPLDDDFLAALRERYRLSNESDLLPLDQPITFIAGRRDRIVGFRDQFTAFQTCANASYVVVADAGHYLPAESPTPFRAAVSSWLS